MQLALFASAFISSFFTASFSSYVSKSEPELRYLLIFLLILLASLTASSRLIGETYSDDLIRYYNSYLDAGVYSFMDYLALNSRELAFQSLNWLLYQLMGDFGIRNFLFIFCFIICSLTSIVIYKVTPEEYRIICILLCLLTPSFLLFSTQLIRQTLAVALFFNYVVMKRKGKYLFLIASIAIHYVVLLFLVPFYLFSKYRCQIFIQYRGLFAFALISLFLFFSTYVAHNYSVIIKSFTALPLVGDKALYLLYISRERVTVGSVFLVSIILFFSSLVFSSSAERFRNSEFSKFVAFYFVFIGIVFLFFDFKPLGERFSPYITTFFPVFFYQTLNSLNLKLGQKVIVNYGFIFLFMFLFYLAADFPHPFSLYNGYLTS